MKKLPVIILALWTTTQSLCYAAPLADCGMVMGPTIAQNHSCCPTGACDCSLEASSSRLDVLSAQSFIVNDFESAFGIYSAAPDPLIVERDAVLSLAHESPTATNPLYELYSDYRL